jgi:hypothetical protein
VADPQHLNRFIERAAPDDEEPEHVPGLGLDAGLLRSLDFFRPAPPSDDRRTFAVIFEVIRPDWYDPTGVIFLLSNCRESTASIVAENFQKSCKSRFHHPS